MQNMESINMNSSIDKKYNVYCIASTSKRLIAKIINFFILVFLAGASNIFDELQSISFGMMSLLILYFGVQGLLLTMRGQSIGKMILGIKIVKESDGKGGGFTYTVLLRTLVNALLCVIPLYRIIDLIMGVSEYNKCAHDSISNTIVIDVRKPVEQITEEEIANIDKTNPNYFYVISKKTFLNENIKIFFDEDRKIKRPTFLIVCSYLIIIPIMLFTPLILIDYSKETIDIKTDNITLNQQIESNSGFVKLKVSDKWSKISGEVKNEYDVFIKHKSKDIYLTVDYIEKNQQDGIVDLLEYTNFFIEDIKNYDTEFSTSEINDTVIDNKKSKNFSAESLIENTRILYMYYIVESNERLYIIQTFRPKHSYEDYDIFVKKIIDNIELQEVSKTILNNIGKRLRVEF